MTYLRNLIWLTSIGIGIYGITKFLEKYLKYYQIGLVIVMFLEILSSIIIFADFGMYEGGSKVLFVIMFILTLLCLASFIHNAKQLREAIIIWLALDQVQQ